VSREPFRGDAQKKKKKKKEGKPTACALSLLALVTAMNCSAAWDLLVDVDVAGILTAQGATAEAGRVKQRNVPRQYS
jgi:hypothetical protein